MTSYPIGVFIIASLALGQDGGTVRPDAAQPKNDAVQPKAAQPKNDPAQPTPNDSTQSKPDPAAPNGAKPAETAVVHKLENVTWNPAAKELSWVVSVWDLNGKMEKPIAKRDYVVRLDNATMKSNGETRSFDTEEARQVRTVMDMISAYAVGSTVWWERGHGEKAECPEDGKGDGKGKDEKAKPSSRPATVSLPGPIADARPVPHATAPAAAR